MLFYVNRTKSHVHLSWRMPQKVLRMQFKITTPHCTKYPGKGNPHPFSMSTSYPYCTWYNVRPPIHPGVQSAISSITWYPYPPN